MSKDKQCKNECVKRTSIGGQAVIEGVMMNGPHRSVLAVRSNKGNIVVEDVVKPGYRDKSKLFKLPIIRGIVAYIESMVLGYKTLMRSADLSGMTELEEEEAKPKSETEQPQTESGDTADEKADNENTADKADTLPDGHPPPPHRRCYFSGGRPHFGKWRSAALPAASCRRGRCR